jgi:hypothetical protein
MDSCMTCKSRPRCDIFAENGSIVGCPAHNPVDNLNSQYTPEDNDEGSKVD